MPFCRAESHLRAKTVRDSASIVKTAYLLNVVCVPATPDRAGAEFAAEMHLNALHTVRLARQRSP